MIEREFIAQKTKEHYIKKYIQDSLKNVGISQIKLKKIPLGEKIIIYTNRPGLIVGSKGANIKDLTRTLKKEFNLENPQIEINEVKDLYLDAQLVAERIASSLERFGSARFKGVGHKIITNVMNAGALGVELVISGKIPGARAKSWRFYQGYLKKCGDIAQIGVRRAETAALLKSGVIGIKVAIMPPDVVLPDRIVLREEAEIIKEEIKEGLSKEAPAPEKPKAKPRSRKKAPAKKAKKEAKEEEKATPAADNFSEESGKIPEEKDAAPVQEGAEEQVTEAVAAA